MTSIEVNGRWRRVDGRRAVRLTVGRYRWRSRGGAHGTLTRWPAGCTPHKFEAVRDDGPPGVCGQGGTPLAAIRAAPPPAPGSRSA